ncbi:MAG TPA: hypothetical protein VGR30_13790 [Candidatus Binatia bacterium]|jgi:hypothetical protein|nr:hypothetical protein [Candidatus Binatia bacterium]
MKRPDRIGREIISSLWHNFCVSALTIMELILKKGDRVRVAVNHQWLPQRCGTIKQVETRTGNCFLVKFDRDELGMWHDEDGDPVLRLGHRDLVLIDGRSANSITPERGIAQLIANR